MKQSANLLYISYFGFIIMGMVSAALGVAWIHMQATFELTLEALGVMLATLTIGRMTMSVISGRLIDRMGMRLFLLLGAVLGATGLLGHIVSPTFEILILSAIFWALGAATINVGVNSLLASYYPPSRLNWLHGFFGIGSTIGPFVVTIIVFDLGSTWRMSYAVLAAGQIVFILLLLVYSRSWEFQLTRGSEEPESAGITDTLRLPIVWISILLFFFHAGTQLGAGQLSNSLFIESRNIDPKTAGTWIGLFWGSLTIGRFLAGLLVDRIGNDLFIRLNTIGATVGAILIAGNFGDGFTFFGLMLMGFTLAPMYGTIISDVPRRVSKAHIANNVGLIFAGSGIGSAVLIGIGGSLAENLGLETIGLYLIAVALGSLLAHEALVRWSLNARKKVKRSKKQHTW